MAELIPMPKLGFDMAEGVLVRWLVPEGETVVRGDVLAEIETDKATVEVEAFRSGVIHKHIVDEGTAVPVGDPIAVIGEPDEQIDFESLLASAPAQHEAEAAPGETPAQQPPMPSPAPQPTPATPQPSGEGFPAGVRSSPLARNLAKSLGVDIRHVQGTGPKGRVVKRDIEAAAQSALPAATTAAAPAAVAPLEARRAPLSKLRAAIGRRMAAAKGGVPHFYVTTEVDAAPMLAMRAQYNELLPPEEKLSINDFIVKAAALALREFPGLNASLDGDAIAYHGEINIGNAVAVEDGLLTVVVRQADRKALPAISAEVRAMAERARRGRVRPEDIEGSTFTVSNLGMFDVDHFIAIINPPEAAILAIGSVREVPLFEGDRVVPAKRMKATISADHRLTDGAEAARWLQVFKRYLEQPLRLVL